MLVSSTVQATPRQSGSDGLHALFAIFGRNPGPGCAYEALRAGKIVVAGAAGLADLRSKIALSPRQALDVGSVSKSFTVAAILQLAAAGKLRLGAPIATYLAGLPAWSNEITVADLIYMRSGIPDFLVRSSDGARVDSSEGADALAGSTKGIDDTVSIQDIMHSIQRTHATDFKPGTQYAYSNANYILLRLLVEKLTDRPLDSYVRQRVLSPLGISPGEERTSPVIGHTRVGGAWRARREPCDVRGASAFWISTDALARWGDAFQSRAAAPRRVVGIVRDANDASRGYAAGLMTRRVAGLDIVYHLGSTGGFTAGVFAIPARHETVAFACNMDSDDLVTDLSNGEAAADVAEYQELVVLRTWLGNRCDDF